MKLIYANSPKWANRSQTAIDLIVRFEGIDEDLPFTANPNDSEAYGRDLYARAAAGEFGVISSFNVAAPTSDQVAAEIRNVRNSKLETEVDAVVSNPLRWADLTPEQQQSYADYRRALLDMTNNPAFPWYDLIVVETDFGFGLDMSKAPWPVAPT